MSERISITSFASVSPLGSTPEAAWVSYQNAHHYFSDETFNGKMAKVARLSADSDEIVKSIRSSDLQFRPLDDTVLYAMAASRAAVRQAGWGEDSVFGVNIGSSRGATGLFEKHHADFLKTGRAHTLASPVTTLGNISSWVAQDLQSGGPEISHSITCSTGLHSVLNGVAWLRAGMAEKFLVGGSEAPLTVFTIAQMRALKIYSDAKNDEFPCLAADLSKKRNTMILGEAASVCCIEKGSENALAFIDGIGFATEIPKHPTSISAEAECLQKSMLMAIGETPKDEIDVIVMHSPGTILGDRSEFLAIGKIFGQRLPMLTTNKWKVGHTFAASGMLNIEMAIMMMQHQEFIGVPFAEAGTNRNNIRKVLVNAVGFGGNAVSILLSRP